MTRISLISLALVAFTQIAAAEDTLQQSNTRNAMKSYLKLRDEVMTKHSSILASYDAKRCRSVVADARDLKMTEADEWSLVCDDFARAELATPALDAAYETWSWSDDIRKVARQFRADNMPKLRKSAENCVAEIDRALAAGAPPKMVSTWGKEGKKLALDELKTAICQPLIDLIAKYGDDPEGLERERFEAKAAPYKAVGIKGDRLDLLIDHNGVAMFGIGGGELTTPKQLKAAKVIFEIGSDDSGWTVRRHAFKGDTLVKVTAQGYRTRPGASAFR